MQQRIDRLRGEIERLRQLARTCDGDLAAQMRALATEMEETARQMQERVKPAPAR